MPTIAFPRAGWWARFALPTRFYNFKPLSVAHVPLGISRHVVVAYAPLRKRFAFVAGNDGEGSLRPLVRPHQIREPLEQIVRVARAR